MARAESFSAGAGMNRSGATSASPAEIIKSPAAGGRGRGIRGLMAVIRDCPVKLHCTTLTNSARCVFGHDYHNITASG